MAKDTNSGAPVPGDADQNDEFVCRDCGLPKDNATALCDTFVRRDELGAANPVPGDAGGALVAAELRRIGLAHFSAGLPGSNAAKDRATLEMAARQIELGVAGAREAFLDLIADAIKFDEQQDESAIYYTLEFTDASLVPLIKALGIEQKFGTMWVDDEAFSTLETPAEAIERTIESAALNAAPAPSDGAGVPAGMVLVPLSVLEPFAEFARNNTSEEGWDGLGCQRERIVDWFGPSDFQRLLASLNGQATPTDEAVREAWRSAVEHAEATCSGIAARYECGSPENNVARNCRDAVGALALLKARPAPGSGVGSSDA